MWRKICQFCAQGWRQVVNFSKASVWPWIKIAYFQGSIFISTFFLSTLGQDFIQKRVANPKEGYWSLAVWEPYLPYWWFIPILVIGLVLRTVEIDMVRSSARLYRDLRDFYKQMGFDSMHGAEIRCVVWVPDPYKGSTPGRLRQITKYYPERTEVAGSTPTRWRESQIPPRFHKVTKRRMEDGHLLPVGVLGECIYHCLQNNDNSCRVLNVPATANYVTEAIERFNFSKNQAVRLTPDRRCFMFLPIMNEDNSVLHGIVFVDSSQSGVFNEETTDKAVQLLPAIAKSLQA